MEQEENAMWVIKNKMFMRLVLLILIVPILLTCQTKSEVFSIPQYEVSSTAISDMVNTVVDSCATSVGCGKIEFLYISKKEKNENVVVKLETMREPLMISFPNFSKQEHNLISFYINETLCFGELSLFEVPNMFEEKRFLKDCDLSDYLFDYSYLDIKFKGEIYNTLVYFDFIINQNNKIEDCSIFIDSGDVDLSEVLKARGIEK